MLSLMAASGTQPSKTGAPRSVSTSTWYQVACSGLSLVQVRAGWLAHRLPLGEEGGGAPGTPLAVIVLKKAWVIRSKPVGFGWPIVQPDGGASGQ